MPVVDVNQFMSFVVQFLAVAFSLYLAKKTPALFDAIDAWCQKNSTSELTQFVGSMVRAAEQLYGPAAGPQKFSYVEKNLLSKYGEKLDEPARQALIESEVQAMNTMRQAISRLPQGAVGSQPAAYASSLVTIAQAVKDGRSPQEIQATIQAAALKHGLELISK